MMDFCELLDFFKLSTGVMLLLSCSVSVELLLLVFCLSCFLWVRRVVKFSSLDGSIECAELWLARNG